MSNKRSCFVIAPIGDSGSETRKRSNQLVQHVLKPAIGTEYEILRADQIGKPGIITSQVVEHVVNDDLVIADLSEHNPNVFYELAIRHALRKPLIQLINAEESIPFDVSAMRTIFLDIHDLDSVEAAKSEIAEQARAALETEGALIETPISVALLAEDLRGSGDLVQKSLGGILEAVADLREEVRGLLAPGRTFVTGEYLSPRNLGRYLATDQASLLSSLVASLGEQDKRAFYQQLTREEMRREKLEHDFLLDAAASAEDELRQAEREERDEKE
jgi:hypothetical protein